VENEQFIKFWLDNWCSQESILEILQQEEQDVPNIDAKVGDFITVLGRNGISLCEILFCLLKFVC